MQEGIAVHFNFVAGDSYILRNARISCSDAHLGIFSENLSNVNCMRALLEALLKKELVTLQFAGQEVHGIITYVDGGNDTCLTVNVAISLGDSNG